MHMATLEDEFTYGVCPVYDQADVAAMTDAELAEGYDQWNRDHGDFDWEAERNTRLIREEILRRARTAILEKESPVAVANVARKHGLEVRRAPGGSDAGFIAFGHGLETVAHPNTSKAFLAWARGFVGVAA